MCHRCIGLQGPIYKKLKAVAHIAQDATHFEIFAPKKGPYVPYCYQLAEDTLQAP